MSNAKPDTILIIDRVDEMTVPADGRPIHPRDLRKMRETVMHATEHAVEEMRENMTRFIHGVQQMLADGAAISGEFQIEEVEVSALVTGEGKIGFAGTGMNLQGETGLKIIFKRKRT
jgi:hypothetical protein